MQKRLSKRKLLSKLAVCFFMGAIAGCNKAVPKDEAPVPVDSFIQVIESSQAAFWLEQVAPLSWTCSDVASKDCLDAYLLQWWSQAQTLAPIKEVTPVRAKAWFFEGDHAWVDLEGLPDTTLEVEARWLLSLFLGLNQWLEKDWRWTILENGQPRQSFSGSIVLPSVLDRDFMESVMTLIENKKVKP